MEADGSYCRETNDIDGNDTDHPRTEYPKERQKFRKVNTATVRDYIYAIAGETYLRSIGKEPMEDLQSILKPMSLHQSADYLREHFSIPLSTEELMNGINRTVEAFYFYTVEPKSGVMVFLEGLDRKGGRMCIATATDRYQVEAALERCRMRQFFSELFTCTEVGSGKDQPLIFCRAMEHLGTDRINTLVIEDPAPGTQDVFLRKRRNCDRIRSYFNDFIWKAEINVNRHRDERRKELIDAAKELVNAHGFEKLTVRALCERVGIVPSAFYYIFKDRNELILAISGGIDEFFTAEADVYRSLPAPRALCEFCLAYMRFIEGTGANCNWQVHMCRRDDPQSYERSENRAVTHLVRQIIARGQQDGSFVPDDPEILFDFIMLFLRGQSFDWSRHFGQYDLCESCRAKLPMLMRALMVQLCEKK